MNEPKKYEFFNLECFGLYSAYLEDKQAFYHVRKSKSEENMCRMIVSKLVNVKEPVCETLEKFLSAYSVYDNYNFISLPVYIMDNICKALTRYYISSNGISNYKDLSLKRIAKYLGISDVTIDEFIGAYYGHPFISFKDGFIDTMSKSRYLYSSDTRPKKIFNGSFGCHYSYNDINILESEYRDYVNALDTEIAAEVQEIINTSDILLPVYKSHGTTYTAIELKDYSLALRLPVTIDYNDTTFISKESIVEIMYVAASIFDQKTVDKRDIFINNFLNKDIGNIISYLKFTVA